MVARGKTAKKTAPKMKARVLVVEARYYPDIADALLAGATAALKDAGVSFDIVNVPGALEIPPAIAILCGNAKKYDGAVALGCVIRGETLHFEIVSEQSARGLMDVSIAHRLPIGNGIQTVDTDAQARIRAFADQGDKGGDAARACLNLIALKKSARR